MNTVNLYLQSRIREPNCFKKIYAHDSDYCHKNTIKEHEIDSLTVFVDGVIEKCQNIELFDGFIIDYHIPQISKEFDLLKITETYCLNIELKSHYVDEECIKEQLEKNQYYLNHLKREIIQFTINTDSKKVYKIDKKKSLKGSSLDEVIDALKLIYSEKYISDINSLFRVSEFLVSPLNTPDRFLNDEYYLTDQQKEEKKNLLDQLQKSEGNFFSLTGNPGTGKTLFLYDIAKEIAIYMNVLIIHCGELPEGCKILNEKLNNVKIITPKMVRINQEILDDFDIIFVDEAHRIYKEQFEDICQHIRENNKKCLFSHDSEQCLSKKEKNANIVNEIYKLNLNHKVKLSKKIRTNKEIAVFIQVLTNLKTSIPQGTKFKNVSLYYADSEIEAQKMIKYLKKKEYVFINFSKSMYSSSPYNDYLDFEDYDSHHVIGQEFNNVLIVMGKTFNYHKGKITANIHPNPNYLYTQLLYQALTRVREKLTIIIVKNEKLFEDISSIFSYENEN